MASINSDLFFNSSKPSTSSIINDGEEDMSQISSSQSCLDENIISQPNYGNTAVSCKTAPRRIPSSKNYSSWKFSSLNCIGLRLLLMTTILSYLFMPSISMQTTTTATPDFSSHQKHLIRKVILQKLGLEGMSESREMREMANSRAPMPLYIWDFYEQANQGDIELLRHYLPRIVASHSNPEIKGWFIVYNLTATGRRKDKELIVKADLRIRLGKEMPSAEEYHRRQEIIHDDEEDEPALLTSSWEKLNIYEVDPEFRENHRLLDTRFLPEDSLRGGDKWIDLDVTPALTRRKKDDQNDLVEFYVERVVSDHTPMSIDFRDSAALIVQVETPETAGMNRRRKRSTKKNKGRRRKQHHSQPKAKNLCRLESLWVDFKQLDWDDWIISPGSYDAYQCRGKCMDAPNARQNYSNHAIMQTLIHSLNASAVPPPCCVPTEMSPLPILYRDVHNTTIVHKYPDMIVEACGCH